MNAITELVKRLRSFAKMAELMEKKTGRKKAVTKALYDAAVMIEELSAKLSASNEWIPCDKELPDDLATVNITWINRDPEPYYEFIKDKPFTATAIYYNDKWYWWSCTCDDILKEYGRNEVDEINDGIEVIAWRPLPEPFRGKTNDRIQS